MNQREAKEFFGIIPFTYNPDFLESSRQLTNLFDNVSRAVERLGNIGKTNRRTNQKRTSTSSAGSPSSAEAV